MTPPGLSSLQGQQKTLIPLIALGVGLVVVLVLWFGQSQQTQQLGAQLAQSRQQLAELDAQHQDLSRELEDLRGERSSLQGRLSALQTQLTSSSSDLDRLRTSLADLQDRYQRLSEERGAMQVQLAASTSERDEARRRAERVEGENAELERAVSRLRERLTLLDRDYRQLTEKVAQLQTNPPSSVSIASAAGPSTTTPSDGLASPPMAMPEATVELPPIIVRKDQAGMSMPVRGRLVEVNEPHNFVVVDKGSQDGVRVGMVFDILRGASPVGRATVMRVRPQLSACDIVRQRTPGPLQAGDVAVQNSP